MKTVICHDVQNNLTEVPVDKLIFRPSVYAVLIEDGKVLLSKQFDGYDFPGGGVDLGETLEEACVREIHEETGIEARVLRPIHCGTSFFHPNYSKKYEGQYWQAILVYFAVEMTGGEISTDHLTEEERARADRAEWVPLDRIDSLKFINAVDSPAVIRAAMR